MAVERLCWTGLPVPAGHEVDVYRDVMRGDHVPHDHDFFEIALALEGHGSHETLYGRNRIGRGDAFAIRPGAWHAFVSCEQMLVVTCVVHPRLLERELLWLAEEPRMRFLLWPAAGLGGIVHIRLSEGATRDCESTLERLAAVPGYEPRPHQYAHLLLLLHNLAGDLEVRQVADAARLASAPGAVFEALRLLDADLSRQWTIASLAASVSVSPTHLTRLFNLAVGRPPMAHLAQLRSEAAAMRLLSGEESVSQVGAAVGWSDPNYFARRFRAHFGTSPSGFRHQRTRDLRNGGPRNPVAG